jgi:hypothetical protein
MAPITDRNVDLCVPCISLVGGGPQVLPHAELRDMKKTTGAEMFRCLTCGAWWDVQKLGWGRLSGPGRASRL